MIARRWWLSGPRPRLQGCLPRGRQIRSDQIPYLDGGWFRAFDYRRWDYWSSSADAGWGAWAVEAGWAQAWTAATLVLRDRHTSFWDFTGTSKVKTQFDRARAELAQNDGRAWTAP